MTRLVCWAVLVTWGACGTALQAGDNLLGNPGFEAGKTLVLHWSQGAKVPGVSYIWDRENGYEGRASLCLHKTAQRFFPIAQWYQTVERQGDSPALDVSAQVKAEQVTKAILDVGFLDSSGRRISHEWASYIGRKNANESPATHDWKVYSGRVAIPAPAKHIQVALQVYGPGKVWFDDVQATYVNSPDEARPPAEAKAVTATPDDVADMVSEKRHAGDDPKKTYFLIHARDDAEPPEAGYRLLIVLPGGDGSEAFLPFVKRIAKRGLPEGYLVAQPVAVKWAADQQIVWPHQQNTVTGMAFSTEEFVEAVIADVRKRHPIDSRYVLTLAWSSGGPAAYAVSLQENSAVTGSYVVMSVFNSRTLPPLATAKGHCYYIEHSPDDKRCPFRMAQRAERELAGHGANVTLSTYPGGHGWRGDVYGRALKAIAWLEANVQQQVH